MGHHFISRPSPWAGAKVWQEHVLMLNDIQQQDPKAGMEGAIRSAEETLADIQCGKLSTAAGGGHSGWSVASPRRG